MPVETYDWSLDYSDEENAGTSTFNSAYGGESVQVTVAQPDPSGYYVSGRDGFETSTQGGSTSGHFESAVNFTSDTQTVTQTISFANNTLSGANSVSNLSFTIFDIDSTNTATFIDQVTILAFDVDGNALTVTLTAVDGSVVSVSGATATAITGAGSGTQGSVNATSTEGNVVVSVSGEVASVQIVYGNSAAAQSNPAQQAIGFGDLSFDLTPTVVCYLAGTLIRTPDGERPVESLRAGDLVITLDHGPQPVRWAGRRALPGKGRLAPVRLAAGAVGNSRPLAVSPQHRLLVTGWRAELWTGLPEVLVPAQYLVNGRTVTQDDEPRVCYHHLLFDRHEVIFANGAPAESLFLGDEAYAAAGAEARGELLALFPSLAARRPPHQTPARPLLRRREARLVA